tara:strand:+ start:377 stop:694 length:318 start_codon:yes stop_codon:yes gene_type:complete
MKDLNGSTGFLQEEMMKHLNKVVYRDIAVTAINKKYQSLVNRAVKHHIKYDYFNDSRDWCDAYDNSKMYDRYDYKCEIAYNKYLELLDELPSREVKNIETIVNKY